ncbi:MAG: FmdB family zinc ribbon protein [Myxococcales bacterium]
MPMYEYECPRCGRFEVDQRITAPALRRCQECGRKVRRLISQTSFALKGSGWYVTDYAKRSSSPEKAGSAKAESKVAKDPVSATA